MIFIWHCCNLDVPEELVIQKDCQDLHQFNKVVWYSLDTGLAGAESNWETAKYLGFLGRISQSSSPRAHQKNNIRNKSYFLTFWIFILNFRHREQGGAADTRSGVKLFLLSVIDEFSNWALSRRSDALILLAKNKKCVLNVTVFSSRVSLFTETKTLN